MALELRVPGAADRAAWEHLWQGYQRFYKAEIPARVTDITWARLHDPAEPMHAMLAWQGDRAVGLVHWIFHRSTWTDGPYCYLQDLFAEPDVRGVGVGRALIAHVRSEAEAAGASRLYWLTHETNTDAMKLYDKVAERSGFVQYRVVL
ncbi:N-acetyltransferase [Novosphingobium sediminis]|uniref:N-acetyltransferase n=1 Tax=Novosphingobium sediminis TaxID=707214 RepID=A0A512AHY6_9SPHN|nr:N-acetyltransferase [Novosphingobium sediminis]